MISTITDRLLLLSREREKVLVDMLMDIEQQEFKVVNQEEPHENDQKLLQVLNQLKGVCK